MNQHLETILNFIQRSKELSADEKSNLSNSVQKANGELEHKNRELEIEASLERMRARTLAMQRSDELSETSLLLFQQFNDLGETSEQISIGIFNENENIMELYSTVYGSQWNKPAKVDLDEPVVMKKIHAAWKESQKSFVIDLAGNDLQKYNEYRKKFSNFHFTEKRWVIHVACFSKGVITFSTTIPHPDETLQLLERFASVFDGTYTRFLDLQKAESQTKEAQIEAGLERVRSRAIAMRKTDELLEAAELVFKELTALGIESMNVSYGFVDKEEKYASFHGVNPVDGKIPPFPVLYPHTETEVMRSILSSWKKQVPFNVIELDEQATVKHQTFVGGHILKMIIRNNLNIPFSVEAFLEVSPKTAVIYSFNFIKGYLFIIGEERLTTMQEEIVLRFTKVFEQAYIRFLDLQKAEAQAREAQIEAALERVRSKTMAMQNSEDILSTTTVVFAEMKKLGIESIRCGVALLSKNSRSATIYASATFSDGEMKTLYRDIEMTDHPSQVQQYQSWLKQENYFTELKGEELRSYYRLPFFYSAPSYVPPDVYDHSEFGYYLPFSEGLFYAWAIKAYTEAEVNILTRFKSIIDLTFRRYFDLKKAEAQAREAQIEAALERVRSKALAMQKAEDLAGAVAIVFDELDKLNLGMLRCGIGILNREKRSADVWTTSISEQGKKVQVSGDESIDIHPLLQGAFDAWLNQHDFSYELKGNDIAEYYTAITKTNFHLPEAQAIAERAKTQPLKQFYYVAPFESGTLFAFRETEFPDEAKKVIKRFAEVFNLTYTRFLDLQKAEAQAKEAQLERKRSEDLLLNILPREIADELKQFGKSYARKHDEVTILFSDIKGFSTISENLSADELVTQLDECFRAFDKIIEKHGLEKIKTVGDAYICACGLPKPVHDNAAKTVRAAMDMLDFLKGFSISKKIQNLPAFEFRIGIHTGPVVTGVVGLKKFTYDIWGDAVNMAARMEQHGEAGRINVSGASYQLIKDKFNCTHRGKIQAKNKGEVDMYFVDSIA